MNNLVPLCWSFFLTVLALRDGVCFVPSLHTSYTICLLEHLEMLTFSCSNSLLFCIYVAKTATLNSEILLYSIIFSYWTREDGCGYFLLFFFFGDHLQ